MKTKRDWIWKLQAGALAIASFLGWSRVAAGTAITYEVIDIPAPHGAVHPPMQVYDVSDDGSVVVGSHYTGTDVDLYSENRVQFLCKDGTLVDLADLLGFEIVEGYRALCISGDGSVIAGSMGTSLLECEAFTYRLTDGQLTKLGFLPGATWSRAHAISHDGSVVVGESGNLAFRWENGVITSLGDLPGGDVDSSARGVSADGSVVVGVSISASGSEAFRWESGVMTALGDLPGGVFDSMATAVSGDGSVVVGSSIPEPGIWEAFRWKDGVMTSLEGDLDKPSEALGVSCDGSVVSGFLGWGWHGGDALYWDEKNAWQPVFLKDLLDGAGVNRDGFDLMDPIVTPDGSTFVGFGIKGRSLQVYRIRLADPVPPPSPVVDIPDVNLEAAVRVALGKSEGDLTAADMESLTALSAPAMGISDLSGLECATNLAALDLSENVISDITALVGLTNLDQLDIAHNCIDLTPGTFSCRIADQLGSNGLILSLEPQDALPAENGTERLVNLSTRGWVGRGDNVLIGGFVVTGASDMRLLIRGIGPSLQQFGVARALSSPVIQIHRAGGGAAAQLVAEVDGADGGPAEAMATEHCGAFALEPGAGDAVLCTRLPPGTYTVKLSGAGGSEGIGMIEVYEVR